MSNDDNANDDDDNYYNDDNKDNKSDDNDEDNYNVDGSLEVQPCALRQSSRLWPHSLLLSTAPCPTFGTATLASCTASTPPPQSSSWSSRSTS